MTQVPSYEDDPLENLRARLEMTQTALAEQLAGQVAAEEAEQAAYEPDYSEQAAYLKAARQDELVRAGMPLEQARAQVQAEAWRLAHEAKATGRRVPDVVREAAAARGYRPKPSDHEALGSFIKSVQREQMPSRTPADDQFDKLTKGW